MASGMHALSPVQRETLLCARGPRDLTPLAQACDAGDVREVSELLSLGAARSIFVQGFRAHELHCTLPYTPVVPERHASPKGRALAEQRREVCENSQALVAAGDVKAAVDAALADYITQLAAGAVEFAAGVENESVAGDDEASRASTVSASPSPAKSRAPSTTDAVDEMRQGDLVRLKKGLEGSSILLSRLNTDNSVASRACLGAAKLRRLGVVVSAASEADIKATNGHTPESLASGLDQTAQAAVEAAKKAPPLKREEELLEAARDGDTNKILLLLKAGTNVNCRDGAPAEASNAVTPLQLAAHHGHTDGLRVLLEYKADTEAKNPNGSTALLFAAHHGHVDAARVLLEHKADIKAKNKFGHTPESLASGLIQTAQAAVEAAKKEREAAEAAHSSGETIWVACVPSGHVCEYLRSDLVFADGSALDVLRPELVPETPAPLDPTRVPFKIDDIVSLAPGAFALVKQEALTGPPGAHILVEGAGEAVVNGYYKKTTMYIGRPWFQKVDQSGIVDPQNVSLYALCKSWHIVVEGTKGYRYSVSAESEPPLPPETGWAPDTVPHAQGPAPTLRILPGASGALKGQTDDDDDDDANSSSDDGATTASGGCCVVTKQNYKGAAKVVRGPDWKWDTQDGGDGNTGILGKSMDSDGWASVRWEKNGHSNKYRIKSAQDLLYHTSDCVCGKAAAAQQAAAEQPASTPSASAPTAAEWMPASGELLAVCSVFHTMSTRGILVSSLTDAKRLWVACADDLVPVRAASCSHVYPAGDLVRLDSGVKEACEGKCLGSPDENRVGRVLSAGVVRKGVQRNIEVAYVNELVEAGGEGGGDRDSKGDIAVSLYSAGDLLPVAPIRYASALPVTADERQGLIECLEALSHTTKTPLVPARLVDKFGLDVFSKLWALFADTKEGYWAVLKAFQTWHLRRLAHVTENARPSDAVTQLIAYRETYKGQSAMESAALRECVACASEEASDDTAETWTCDGCCVVNPAGRASCRVCEEQMPTWECVRCVQVNPCTRAVCRHCHTPLVGSAAPRIAHGAPAGQTGQTRAVTASVAAANDGASSRAQVQALLGGRSVVFLDESPETMQTSASKPETAKPACRQTCLNCQQTFESRNQLFKHLGSTRVCARAPSPAAESQDRAPSTYYGCRVQVKSTCALNGKCGRILSVASPAASAPTCEQSPRGQLQRDAVGRIFVEDGAARMRAPGIAQAFTRDQLRRDAVGRIFVEDGVERMCAPGKAQAIDGDRDMSTPTVSVAPSSAATTSKPDMIAPTGAWTCTGYMCEFRVDGKLQVVPVEARNLSWLPGKPSNFPLPDQTCDGPGQADGVVQGARGCSKALGLEWCKASLCSDPTAPHFTFGLAWEDVGTAKPTEGRRLTNAELAAAVASKVASKMATVVIKEGCRVRASATFTSNSMDKKEVPKDTLGSVIQIDNDGDAEIDFEGIGAQWVKKKKNFGNVSVVSLSGAQIQFAQEELDAFGFTDLRSTDFIEVGGSYYRPAANRAHILENAGLEEALKRKTEFTQGEWDAFGVRSLRMLHLVKAGDAYYRPAGTEDGAGTAWQIGALVRLLDKSGSRSSDLAPGLAPGRGTRSIGCISSVDLEHNKVSLYVLADSERCLAECCDVKIGDEVHLAVGYAALQDASKGPLVAGQKGSVKALRDGLVLVESTGQASKPNAIASRPSVGCKVRLTADYKKVEDAELGPLKPGDTGILKLDDKSDVPFQVEAPDGTLWHYKEGAIEEIFAEPSAETSTNAQWWYEPETLVLASTSGCVQTNHTLRFDSIESSGSSQKGVFFNIVNTSDQPILITEIEAGAYGGSRDACLFACKHGACAGHETNDSSWRAVWKGKLNDRSATSCIPTLAKVRLAPGEVQGFLLHSNRDGVLYSSSDKVFKDANVSVQPWYATSSSSPHGSHQSSKYVPAGKVSYVLAKSEIVTMNLTDLQLVSHGNAHDLPVVEVNEFITSAARPISPQRSNLPPTAGSAAKENVGSKQHAKMDASDVPSYPEDEAIVNDTLYNAEEMCKTEAKKPEATPQCGKVSKLMREDSSPFYENCDVFKVINNFQDFVSWRDRGGNTVAHHLAMADMPRSLKALYAENKESRWVENDVFETPQTVSDCVQTITPRQSVLHRALHDGNLLRTGSAPVPVVLIRAALRWPEEEDCDESAPDVRKMETALANGRPDEVLVLACQASDRPEGRLYSALAMLELKYSPKQVQLEIRQYLEAVLEDGGAGVSPLLYYIRFRLYQQQASKSAQGRQQAACAVAALRCFPAFAARWLRDQDSVMVQQLMDRQRTDVDSGDEEDFAEDVEECGTAAEWRVAKADHQLKSKSMDELMGLTGLRQIKRQAMGIVKEVLLQRDRPASVKAQTSMNFLFTGNPGCGKTTVARLLANCLSELGFRTKGIVETSAQDILKLKCPAGDFQTMFESAKGGTLFIDEAYRFSPAGASQQPNASNQVLDFLLEAVEKQEIRDTTTVILAGYGDEIEDLLRYNVGFASRFPLEFRFEDYDHKQLRAILHTMVKARGMQLQRKSVCGVAISDVVARRIHQGAGRKGFGNARAVRNKLEQIVTSQSQRIGTLKLRKQPVSEKDYQIITALDAIGARPNFACCAPVRDLNAMAGLIAVKAEFRKLLLMAQQNYDREMKGDAPESISLHRVFYGNPGTGKSTVARLYGALLKELGLLSKGDFIAVTPADLTGDAEGGAAANTRAVLERAKGKVLLIDEAYILDPRRKNNQYGGNVLDTLVEKLDGEAGADIAVILAGYKQEMFDMLDNNPGLRRRFNIDDFGMHFQDMSDDELKQVLVAMASNCGLVFENLDLVDAVVALVAQKRRMPGFGNAGTVGSMLNFAKASKAARLDQAQQAADEARRKGAEVPTLPDPDVLVRSDFIPQEVDVEQARDAFSSLYNVEHIMQLMDNFEAIIMAATADGLEPADILADAHMVFVGPPGTGKTTVANRFGKLFKDLKVLPSDTVTCVTGTSLMGQYVGETKEKVLRAMNQARGGILFIDEAYGLSGSSTGSSSFGREAIDTLVGNITQAEFKGNLLVIMAGYEHCMDALFANANPGFSSRFNKKRVVFEPWTAQQAGDAVISEIVRCDKTVTPEAEAAVHDWCRLLEPLPSWGSARDVFDAILPALYTERASRLRAASKHASPGAISTSSAYQAEDVNAALAPITMSRRKLALAESKPVCYTPPMRTATPGGCGSAADNGFPGADAGAETCQTNPKHKVKHKIRRIDNHDEDAEDEAPEPDVWAALEQACQELGYDIEYIAQFLEEGEYPQELLDKIVSITACNDVGKIRSMLDQQKGAFQKRLQLLIEHRLKEKSEEEARCQQKLQRMGRCPMDFEWLKEDGGWRCAGGSHYVSDADVSQFDA